MKIDRFFKEGGDKIIKSISIDRRLYERAIRLAKWRGWNFSKFVEFCLDVVIDELERKMQQEKQRVAVPSVEVEKVASKPEEVPANEEIPSEEVIESEADMVEDEEKLEEEVEVMGGSGMGIEERYMPTPEEKEAMYKDMIEKDKMIMEKLKEVPVERLLRILKLVEERNFEAANAEIMKLREELGVNVGLYHIKRRLEEI